MSQASTDVQNLFQLPQPIDTPLPSSNLHTVALSFLCGCFGGVANIICSHPLDTIKVRMQMLDLKLYSCFRSITQTEGLLALYKGLMSPLFNVPILYAIYFGAYDLVRCTQKVTTNLTELVSQSAIAGAWAGLAVTIAMTPVELVKCRLQMEGTGQKAKLMTAFGMTKQIIKRSGTKELYKGTIATILREIPAGAVYFGTYEFFKSTLQEAYGKSMIFPLIGGGAAGLLSWAASYPQDVIKTKLQCDIGTVRKYPAHHYFKDGGVISCAKDIWTKNGAKGFVKGFSACSIKAIIAEAMTFFVYENTKAYIDH